jgi:hypothetical protein
MSQEQIRRKIYRVFDPIEALRPDDPRYVECNDVRGSAGLLKILEDSIRLSDRRTCQLLSGPRGCGKTTELFRLRHLLTREPAYFVIYCESDDYIDLNDTVEYPEVLLAVVQQLWQEADRTGLELTPGRFQAFLEDLWGILSAVVQPKDAKLKLGIAELGFELKRNPNYRQLVRDHLRPRAADFLQAVNEVLEHAMQKLQRGDAPWAGLVVIVDNLDRMLRQAISGTTRTSHEKLFVDTASQLSDLACHVIYTLPPALLHSPHGSNLARLYGTEPRMLPMIPVAARTGAENEQGLEKLLETIQKRLRYIGAETAFDSASTARRLCVASGGYVRSLMTLARQSTLYTTELPITRAGVEQAIRDMRDSFVRGIRPSQWPMLRGIATTRNISEAEECLQLLENLAVLEYRDGDGPWYDVHPVVREAKEFAA